MSTVGRITPAPKPLEVARSATQLTLPWPPSVNAYWQAFALPGGRVIMTLTKRARMYRSDVAEAIRQQMGTARIAAYTTPVRIDQEFRAPDRRARDLDNFQKGLWDSLTHAGVWKDDALVDEFTGRRGRVITGGAVILQIAPLDREPEPAQQALDLVDPADEPAF